MKKLSIALVAVCLFTSYLAAQSTAMRSSYGIAYGAGPLAVRAIPGRNLGVRQNPDGSMCFPAPFYQNCIYDFSPFSLGFYPLWTVDNPGKDENDLRSPSYTNQPQAPPPPVTPALHEYNWPAQGDTSATFSIVTASGTVYLATMAWVEGENLHFNSVDGGGHQISLSAVSRPLTQAANARKNLTLPLPSTEPVRASVATTN